MEGRIRSFLDSEKNLTIGTAVDNVPYCANCFFAFDDESKFLFLKSDRKTKHIRNALRNGSVAGTIVPDILKTGTIKGVQFTGKFTELHGNLLESAKNKYYRKYPFALIIPGELWGIELLSVKMTDNTLGFGRKLTWERSAQEDACI